MNEGGRILRLGSVDDASLELLYRGAWITANPSLGQGYGLPVAEAPSAARSASRRRAEAFAKSART